MAAGKPREHQKHHGAPRAGTLAADFMETITGSIKLQPPQIPWINHRHVELYTLINSGTVSYSRGQGKKICWTQGIKASLRNIARPWPVSKKRKKKKEKGRRKERRDDGWTFPQGPFSLHPYICSQLQETDHLIQRALSNKDIVSQN